MRQFKHKKDKYLNKDISIEKFTVEYNKFNLEDFKNALKSSTVMEKTYHKAKEKYPMWPEIHQDIWDALFKYDPYLFDENTVDTRYALNRGVMEAVMKSEHYKELRQLTRLDLLGTTMGTESLSEDVQKLIEDLKEQFEEALAEFEAAEEALKQMEGDGDSNQKGAGEGQEDDEDENGGKKHGKPNDNKKWSLEEAQKRLEEARNKLNTVVDKKAAGKINRFVNAAIVKTKEVTDMISAWGLEQSDTFVKSGFQEKMKMLDRLRNNPKLKRIADLAGRYKRHAVALQKQKIKFGTDSIHNVITGDDIGRILPSEAMKLKNRLWNKLFKKSLLEKTVLQYEYRGKEKIAKGAIVCCVDSSGSMDGAPEVDY